MLFQSLLLVFPALMVFAAASDLLSMTISNKVPLLLAAVFVGAGFLSPLTFTALGLHVIIGLTVLFVTFGCFAMGWMGGGDAKLLASTALWLGPTNDLVFYFLVSSVLGGALTIAIVCARSVVLPVTGVTFVDRILTPTGGIPYGIALGVAGIVTFADSQWLGFITAS